MDENTIKQVYTGRKSFKSFNVDDYDIQHKFLIEYLPDNFETRILDAGCGNGKRSLKLHQSGYKNITAIDLFDSIPVKEVNYIRASIEDLPFEPESFDFVFSMSVIYYSAEPERAIREFYRVLQTGGTLLFTAHTRYSLFTLKRVIFRALNIKSVRHLDGVKFRSAREYVKFLNRNGFEIIRVDGFYLSFILVPAYNLLRNISRKYLHIELPAVKTSISSNKVMRRIKSVIGYHMVLVAKKS